MQRNYDAWIKSFESGVRGWVGKGPGHGLWNDDGRRFTGASGHSAFWKGYEGLTLKAHARGVKRPLYVAGTLARAAYMAGRDCAAANHRLAAQGKARVEA